MTSKTKLITQIFFQHFISEIVLNLILLEFLTQKIFSSLSKKFEIFFNYFFVTQFDEILLI